MNETESTTYQDLWDTMKAVPRRKFIAINAYVKEQEISQIELLKKATNRFQHWDDTSVRINWQSFQDFDKVFHDFNEQVWSNLK